MIELTAVKRAGNRIGERAVRVDPTARRAAELTAALVCKRLGLPTVRVRWLSPDRTEIRGETLPVDTSEVWIRAGQPISATVETVSHECRHAWQLQDDQYRWTRPGLDSDDGREQDAREYGLAIRRELTGG